MHLSRIPCNMAKRLNNEHLGPCMIEQGFGEKKLNILFFILNDGGPSVNKTHLQETGMPVFPLTPSPLPQQRASLKLRTVPSPIYSYHVK